MNFSYLKEIKELNKLYSFCKDAEDFALNRPSLSIVSSRKAMEYIVKMIYSANISDFEGLTVFEMLSDYRFIDYVDDKTVLSSMHYIRKLGNAAAHGDSMYSDDAKSVLEQLHFLVGEFCILLGLIKDYPEYQKPGLTVERKEEKLEQVKPEKVVVEAELISRFAPRMRHTHFDVKAGRNEEENRKLFISAALREAGWPIVVQHNQAMPCAAGINMIIDKDNDVDFVLYGRDNKPLAIVEYSTTVENLVAGRLKAIGVANKMAKSLGYKPIIYYTNGYYIYIIDQLGYGPRRVFQFHNIEELELLKLRASIRKDISKPEINDEITNRKYQKDAIKAVCKAFRANRRHSLLVMATGTGKTRVAISLVDILLKNNWAKNVLFLADRTSLVHQAHKNFNKLLPNVTTSIYSGGTQERDPNARIIFSTYQTMIKLINDDTREFSVGRFDLIIIDEAHRSIFAKYGALFHYFDALMVGLTATPRSDIFKSSYEVFHLPDGSPDYTYELETAISDGYLVGFTVLDRTTQALRRGICYDDLSDDEKCAFEDAFASGDDEDEDYDFSGTELKASQLRKDNYINLGTIDTMLNHLMKNGLKVENGDKLGKTIIFSRNHVEAEKIVERFQKLYPNLDSDFCKLIDSKVEGNLTLIDQFGERDKYPQVVVSVDMMDTGIDVPDVLNLVFFKRITAKIKFLQMIGRGTRLSPDIFGPGMDKQGFLVFDFYDNFRYFRTRNTWKANVASSPYDESYFQYVPQSTLIYEKKLSILQRLEQEDALTDFDQQYLDEIKQSFIDLTRSLCNDEIDVQYNMSAVSKYRTAENWNDLSGKKYEEIKKQIIPLLPSVRGQVKVKNFDLLMYTIEDEVPKRAAAGKDVRKIRYGFGNVIYKMDAMLEELTKLKTIPAIVQKQDLISKLRNGEFLFQNFSLERCEYARTEIRDLMNYIPDEKRYYIIDVKDYVIGDSDEGTTAISGKSYAQRAMDYISKGNPSFAKIQNLDALTDDEKKELETVFKSTLGSESDYYAWSGNKPLLPFLRQKLGITDNAILTKFGDFYNSKTLNEDQLEYVNHIIHFVKENGDITFLDLQKVSPFCDIDIMQLFGEKIGHIKTLINGLHQPVM